MRPEQPRVTFLGTERELTCANSRGRECVSVSPDSKAPQFAERVSVWLRLRGPSLRILVLNLLACIASSIRLEDSLFVVMFVVGVLSAVAHALVEVRYSYGDKRRAAHIAFTSAETQPPPAGAAHTSGV